MTNGNPWFPFGSHPEAGIKLLCLPHAGAGAATYQSWGRGLPHPIKACSVQPPGRERRRADQPYTDVLPLAKELATEIVGSVQPPYALLGHSTGALCAFETVHELHRIGGPLPVHLFVSGRCAPHVTMPRHDVAAMSLPELSSFLRQLDGTPEEVLANPELLALIQPVLAADFRVNEEYEHIPAPPLEVPLTAFAGVHDPGAGPAEMKLWARHTSREFVLHDLLGGHFAIFDQATTVHGRIAEALAPYLRFPGRD